PPRLECGHDPPWRLRLRAAPGGGALLEQGPAPFQSLPMIPDEGDLDVRPLGRAIRPDDAPGSQHPRGARVIMCWSPREPLGDVRSTRNRYAYIFYATNDAYGATVPSRARFSR